MKVLLITGRLAQGRIREMISKQRGRHKVHVADVDVAAMLTPKKVAEELKRAGEFDMLLVPGLMRGDLRAIERTTGIPTYRGPKDAADLETVLENLGRIKLSKEVPADELLRDALEKKAAAELRKVDSKGYRRRMLARPWNITVGGLAVGRDFPMRVVAEIPNAEDVDEEELLRRGKYLADSGADVVAIGIADTAPEKVESGIEVLRKFGVPIAVDTASVANMRSAVESKADLLLSFDAQLLEEFKNVEAACVVIPSRGAISSDPEERIRALEENLALAKTRGFKRLIADPILQPANQGLVDSLAAYRLFSKKHGDGYPVLLGAGNVTELMDADSVGINALLASMGSECDASMVFTVEASDKTRGSTRELARAAKMAYLAKIRDSTPKDLGLDLLVLKEKRLKREPALSLKVGEINAKKGKPFAPDTRGYFEIYVGDTISCVHFSGGKPTVTVVGDDSTAISDTLLRLGLVGSVEHAMYLGRELKKAEFALRYGRSYVQE